MAGLGDIFSKGSTAEQFLVWGVLQQLLQPLLFPVSTELGKLVNSAAPTVPLSPQDAAALVARKLIDQGTGQDIANDNGIGESDFTKLVTAAGSAPDLGAVISAYQRQLIGAGADVGTDLSLEGALADAGVRPDWFPIIEKLAVQIPTVAEVMNAWLEGQIDEDEARTRYLAAGGDPTWFQTSYNANGTAPTPSQALELLNRGIIPEDGTGPDSISYQQAFLEGPWRNKWLQPFIALREYLPPPRTVTAMYHAGQLDHDTAASLLTKQGLTADLVTAYLSPSKAAATTAEKTLAKSDITSLYAEGIMSKAAAITHLEALKYTAADAALILELIDVQQATAQVKAGVSRVRSLYQSGKLTTPQAKAALVDLDITADQAGQIIDTWNVTTITEPKTLTAAQIESAWYYELMSTADALDALQQLGYDAADAWMVLAIKNKGPLSGVPQPK